MFLATLARAVRLEVGSGLHRDARIGEILGGFWNWMLNVRKIQNDLQQLTKYQTSNRASGEMKSMFSRQEDPGVRVVEGSDSHTEGLLASLDLESLLECRATTFVRNLKSIFFSDFLEIAPVDVHEVRQHPSR